MLNDTINMSDFESFKAADVYALGLVFWEICQRCQVSGVNHNGGLQLLAAAAAVEEQEMLLSTVAAPTNDEFKLPYSEFVGSDPSLEEMRKVVCIDQLRPEVPPSWLRQGNSFMAEMHSLMKECWYDSAAARYIFNIYLYNFSRLFRIRYFKAVLLQFPSKNNALF